MASLVVYSHVLSVMYEISSHMVLGEDDHFFQRLAIV